MHEQMTISVCYFIFLHWNHHVVDMRGNEIQQFKKIGIFYHCAYHNVRLRVANYKWRVGSQNMALQSTWYYSMHSVQHMLDEKCT